MNVLTNLKKWADAGFIRHCVSPAPTPSEVRELLEIVEEQQRALIAWQEVGMPIVPSRAFYKAWNATNAVVARVENAR